MNKIRNNVVSIFYVTTYGQQLPNNHRKLNIHVKDKNTSEKIQPDKIRLKEKKIAQLYNCKIIWQ
ncbi:hypothetical protein [Candidatus Uabimicrobium sp. HlEnr_7]|uniref:hypothetical protein n=1 Tax=Candidatus Uabimicrobium helgolandensis TaxID=3095367 RepID=UPI003557856D